MSKAITKKKMGEKRAREIITLMKANVSATEVLAKELYDEEGWEALGYDSFDACMKGEFGLGHASTYLLLQEGEIVAETGDTKLSGRATRALKDVPKGERKAALETAKQEHDTEKPSEKQVAATVKKNWAASGVKKEKKAKAKPISEQAKDDEGLKKALAIIGGTCNRNFRAALEDGTVPMTKADIVKLSEQDDETMILAEKLLSVNGWKLSRCLSFLSKMPTEKDRIETILWLAMAAPNGYWEGEFGSQKVTVEPIKKKR